MPGESISSAAVSLYLAPTYTKSLLFTYWIFYICCILGTYTCPLIV